MKLITRPSVAHICAFLVFILTCFFQKATAQTADWVVPVGGNGKDFAVVVRTAPNGNILVSGDYRGTVDLDPTPGGLHTITSYNNTQDMFVACYAAGGTLLWGFSLGREDFDGMQDITFDAAGNVYIGGFFRGTSVDFDPGPGVTALTCKGFAGAGSSPWAGDGFVAKYSPTGNFQWVIQIGETYLDMVSALAIDPATGDLFVGGGLKDEVDMDPSGATYNLNSNTNGSAFLAKYTTNGAFLWAFNFGKTGIAAVDNGIRRIAVDASSNVYATGFFQGSNIDFDPGPGTVPLTAAGNDLFVAKYSGQGNYAWAFNLGTPGQDDGFGIALDAQNNVYVSGYVDAHTIDLDPSPANAPVSSPGAGANILLAKYSSAGQYIWGHVIGGNGWDGAYEVAVHSSSAYLTGGFSGTVDFDPSSVAASYSSSGNTDAFLMRYDLNGNYMCGFKLGATGEDVAYSLNIESNGKVYLTGMFSNTVDFDPSSGTMNASSAGDGDFFVAKYDWTGTPNSGILSGSSGCINQPVYLTYSDVGAPATVSVDVSDGSSTTTYTVQNGVPFQLLPPPSTTTVYTIVNADKCSAGTPDTALVTIFPKPIVSAGQSKSLCKADSVQLDGTGAGTTIAWHPVTNISNPSILNPKAYISGLVTYTLVVTDANGCTDSSKVTFDIAADSKAFTVTPADTSVCNGTSFRLRANGADNYKWSPSGGLSSDTSNVPFVTVDKTTTYYVRMTDVCGRDSTLAVKINMLPDPQIVASKTNDIDCFSDVVQLSATGGKSYTWWPADWLSSATSANPVANPKEAMYYTVAGLGENGCTGRDTIDIEVKTSNNVGVPNAFTPNSDGKNDCYKLILPLAATDFEFSIFNRWGVRVYHSTDPTGCWDGKYNGVEQPLGTYMYYFQYKTVGCGDEMKKGSIHLIR